jgi:2-dehydropantoate 2-reductase
VTAARLRVLVVGAGAVGLVYGTHLQRGGAEVALYVRERRRAEAEAGYALTRVGVLGGRTTHSFVPDRVVTSADEVRVLDPDQAWVATATDALDEPWLASVLAASARALVVFLQPGGDALERMKTLVPDETRRVRGAIAMTSWHAPLEGSSEPREKATPNGYAYLFPPLAPTGLEGPRASEAIEALRRGGCPAARANVTASLAHGSAILLPHMAALEAAGWSIATLASREISELAASSSREALTIASRRTGIAEPFARRFARGWVTRLAARVARWIVPFDLEVYLRVHFLKVRAQTMLILDEYVRDGTGLGLPHDAIARLRERIRH